MDNYLNTLSPYIRFALDNKVPPPWKLKERVLYDYELLYVKEGIIEVVIEDVVYQGQTGDIFLFKPNQRHTIEIIGNQIFRQPHIHFDLVQESDSKDVKVSFKGIKDMTSKEKQYFRHDPTLHPPHYMPNHIRLKNVDYFEKKMNEIIVEYQKKLPFYETQIKGLFIQLWTYLVRKVHWQQYPQTSSQRSILSGVKAYIEDKAAEDICLGELATNFNVSKYYLIRLFKDAYKITPIHYHQSLRIEKSKELLQFTDLSITEIAEQLGFSSVHAFSRAFKKVDNVAPSYYRRR